MQSKFGVQIGGLGGLVKKIPFEVAVRSCVGLMHVTMRDAFAISGERQVGNSSDTDPGKQGAV